MSATVEGLAKAYVKRWLWKVAAPVAIPVMDAMPLLIIPLAVIAGAGA